MKATRLRQIGATALQVTQLGLRGTAVANMYRAVDEQDALDTFAAAFQAGVRHFDTAPLYGFGLSETRVGKALANWPRDQLVISTKVGWALEPLEPDQRPSIDIYENVPRFQPVMNYSRDSILRSFEESLKRLDLDRVDIVMMHDPDEAASAIEGRDLYESSHFDQAMDEAYPVLDDLRRQGTIQAIGVGINQWQMLRDFARAGDFDCFLLAGRYTLLEQEPLHEFLPLCAEKQISVIIGGPFNSGILATGAVEGAYYNYQPAKPEILDRVHQIESVCSRHHVPLPAATLQFPLAHPTVATVIPGAGSVAELQANIDCLEQPIPADLWDELKHLRLLDRDASVPLGAD